MSTAHSFFSRERVYAYSKPLEEHSLMHAWKFERTVGFENPSFQKGQKVKIPDAYQVKNLPKINWWRVSKRSLWTSAEDTECFLEGRVVPPSLWRWWKDSPETADENPGTKQQEPAERNSEPAAKPQQWWRKLSADYRRLCQVCCYLEATGLTGPKPGSKVWSLFEIPPKYNVKTHLFQSCA